MDECILAISLSKLCVCNLLSRDRRAAGAVVLMSTSTCDIAPGRTFPPGVSLRCNCLKRSGRASSLCHAHQQLPGRGRNAGAVLAARSWWSRTSPARDEQLGANCSHHCPCLGLLGRLWCKGIASMFVLALDPDHADETTRQTGRLMTAMSVSDCTLHPEQATSMRSQHDNLTT